MENVKLMLLNNVVDFFAHNSHEVHDLHQFEYYINTSVVKPYDELTIFNVYVTTDSLNKFLGEYEFRKMECHVTTLLDEKRWFHQLNEASIESIEF